MKLRRLQRQVCRQISGSPWLSLPSLSSTSTSQLSFQSSKSGSKSSHNGVQFFISHLHSGLRTRRFREPTFRPSGATNHWKNTVFRDFFTFSRTWIFFLLRLSLWFDILSSSLLFSSLTLPTSAFHLSILSEVWLLNFLRQVIFSIFLHLASGHFAKPAWKLAVVRWRYGQRSLQRTSKQQINAPLHLLP